MLVRQCWGLLCPFPTRPHSVGLQHCFLSPQNKPWPQIISKTSPALSSCIYIAKVLINRTQAETRPRLLFAQPSIPKKASVGEQSNPIHPLPQILQLQHPPSHARLLPYVLALKASPEGERGASFWGAGH